MQTERFPGQNKPLMVGLCLTGHETVVVVGLLLREYGPGNMGNGFLVGGALGLAAAGIGVWRAMRRPQSVTTFERAFAQTGDERDNAVFTRALAVMGPFSVLLTCAAVVAIGLGAPVEVALAVLLFTELLTGAVAFQVINRRS
ncbi:hypothetical protein ACU18_09370 [Arthrobacter sp. ZBG10]|uniref:hypothetical protein n=1 Tax=Arthrobacter sp. ZBG10 TaxID=1676590 RepID=UPI0006807597|nr:hypothetical protein [Arthrobacter sp. ZBG10]KNH17768.1 hypothetical protein ACU18_09370 [Arthrobacter sp. ZBG10]